MRSRIAAVIIVAAIVVGASVLYVYDLSALNRLNVTTSSQHQGNNLLYLEVAGSLYYAAEVTDELSVPSDGYSHFTNNSMTFMGVVFQTVCPSSVIGCPGSTSVTTTDPADVGTFIKVTMTFPDGSKETVVEAIGTNTVYAPKVSNHVKPTAGILVEYFASTKSFRAFLLVTPYKSPGV